MGSAGEMPEAEGWWVVGGGSGGGGGAVVVERCGGCVKLLLFRRGFLIMRWFVSIIDLTELT